MKSSGQGTAVGMVLAAALALGAGCSHTQTVKEGAGEATRGHETPPVDRKAPPAHAAEAAAPHGAPPVDRAAPPAHAPAAAGPRATPVASSPSELLKPGAGARIQEKLNGVGLLHEEPSGELDSQTLEALRQFQRDSDLPATGMPDDATVRKLGLDPGDVFKHAEAQPRHE